MASDAVDDAVLAPASALDEIVALAEWSAWMPLVPGAASAPAVPGVYLARRGPDGPLLYVGHAGPRSRSQPGLRGRLTIYARGKGAVSGLGEAALDRALRDPAFVRHQLAELDAGRPGRAKDWASAALRWADVHVAWTTRSDKASAEEFESELLARLCAHELWNRRRPRPTG